MPEDDMLQTVFEKGEETPFKIASMAKFEVVIFAAPAAGFLLAFKPEEAIECARRLLVEADKAQGKLPSHLYVVDNRE